MDRRRQRRSHPRPRHRLRRDLHRRHRPHPHHAYRVLPAAARQNLHRSPGNLRQTHLDRNPPAVTETSILHADAERDESFSARFFALGQTAFDHNYSQGLDLQQIYGGGIGYTPLKDDKQELDIKATIQYEKQAFQNKASNDNLIGSTISETYHRALPKKFVLSEFGNIIPSFNIPKAYSANASATLTLPVYKRLSMAVTGTDNYLNNPSAGFNKNSFQFVLAATYTLK